MNFFLQGYSAMQIRDIKSMIVLMQNPISTPENSSICDLLSKKTGTVGKIYTTTLTAYGHKHRCTTFCHLAILCQVTWFLQLQLCPWLLSIHNAILEEALTPQYAITGNNAAWMPCLQSNHWLCIAWCKHHMLQIIQMLPSHKSLHIKSGHEVTKLEPREVLNKEATTAMYCL